MWLDARRWTGTHSEAEAARPGIMIVRGVFSPRRGPEIVASREGVCARFMRPVCVARVSHGLVIFGVDGEAEVVVIGWFALLRCI